MSDHALLVVTLADVALLVLALWANWRAYWAWRLAVALHDLATAHDRHLDAHDRHLASLKERP